MKRSDGDRIGPFVILCLIVIVIWGTSLITVRVVFADWQARGTFGDSFGAVNALFSGLAMAGVVYAILLQRAELRAQREDSKSAQERMDLQLSEMRRARELISQPLVLPLVKVLNFEKPRVFFSPPDRKSSVQSRCFIEVGLDNPTDSPAVGVFVRVALRSEVLPGGKVVDDCFRDHAAPGAKADGWIGKMMFLDADTKLIAGFLDTGLRRDLRMIASIFYRNISGGYFRVDQEFGWGVCDPEREMLSEWASLIVSFKQLHQADLAILDRDEVRSPKWGAAFDRLLGNMQAQTDKFPEFVNVEPYRAERQFSFMDITATQYSEEIGKARLPMQRTQPDDACVWTPGEEPID